VPPGSGFAFHVVCDLPHLQRLAPELAEGERWKTLLQAAFSHAFAWLGFGAKTSVGYGAMHEDREASARAEAAAEERRRERVRAEELARMTPNQQTILAFCDFARQRVEQLRGGRERQNADFHTRAKHLAEAALGADWAPAERRAAAEAVETWLPRIVERLDRKDDWKQARKKLRLAELYGDAN
jgi:CRISPR-associated protein Cmr6